MNRFRELLHYSRRQRRSLVLLCALILLLLSFQVWFRYYRPLTEFDQADFQAFIRAWALEDSMAGASYPNPVIISFDPNKVSDSLLRELSVPQPLAGNWLRYVSKGGHFNRSEDLLRLYGMDSTLYGKLAPLVAIPAVGDMFSLSREDSWQPLVIHDSIQINQISREELLSLGLSEIEVKGIISFRTRFRPFREASDLFQVYNLDSLHAVQMVPNLIIRDDDLIEETEFHIVLELNSVDSAGLVQLPGVGSYYAQKIIAYRKRLGGYVDVMQLMEIGIDSSKLAGLSGHLVVDLDKVQKLDINRADLEELSAHPYLRKAMAKSIIRFREEYRQFKSIDEVMNLELIDGVLFSKIAPYLSVDANPR